MLHLLLWSCIWWSKPNGSSRIFFSPGTGWELTLLLDSVILSGEVLSMIQKIYHVQPNIVRVFKPLTDFVHQNFVQDIRSIGRKGHFVLSRRFIGNRSQATTSIVLRQWNRASSALWSCIWWSKPKWSPRIFFSLEGTGGLALLLDSMAILVRAKYYQWSKMICSTSMEISCSIFKPVRLISISFRDHRSIGRKGHSSLWDDSRNRSK
jgi:hypothetical protein